MRRLGGKTQVLAPGTADDFSRTRLTHSLEVAQIGREMGRSLGADPDLVDTACLAHDIGHPPFGHNGELALAQAAAAIGGFEGNAQTLRVLTRIEPKVQNPDGTSAGLNLTRASLDACIKYPWEFAARPSFPDGQRSPKFGVYQDDMPVFNWVRAFSFADSDGHPRRSIEAQIMDLADDIAYSVHDVEDAVVSGRVNFGFLDDPDEVWQLIASTQDWYGHWNDADELSEALVRLKDTGLLRPGFDGTRAALAALKDSTSSLIGRFSGAAQVATRGQYGPGPLTRYNGQLVIPPDIATEILVLKGIAVTYMMYPREQEPFSQRQREIITELMELLSARAPEVLEPEFASDWRQAPDDAARLRAVVDQIASFSDTAALHWHGALTGNPGPTSLA
jgi:dGTPase